MAHSLTDHTTLPVALPARPAAMYAARFTRLAASDCDDAQLLVSGMDILREALRGVRMAAYRTPDAREYMAVCRPSEYERLPAADECTPAAEERRMRAIAYWALRSAGQVLTYRVRARGELPASHFVTVAVAGTSSAIAFVAEVPEGAYEEARATVAALIPELGALVRTAGLRRELARSARRQSQLQAIFTHSSEAILTVDRDFTILEGNPALSSLLELGEASPVGLPCSNVLRCHDDRGQSLCGTDGCPLAQAFVLTNSAPYREVTWRTASGKSKEVSASFAAVPSSEGVRGVIIARDMTPVNAANRMRSNFVSMVSHELRNPLNSINGFLEIVLEGHVGTLTTRQEEFLEYARMSTHQLMTLVEDILFISRADTGQFKLRFAPVSLSELSAQLMMQFGPVAERAQVGLTVSIPDDLPTVHMDQLRIQQVISNLLNNAIKFTPPGGAVTMCAAAGADAILVEVADTGAGIPIEDHERIFERFFQSAANSLTQAGGYGLGLAIARLIVQQHGGRIWVASAPGHGSTFSFTIPILFEPPEPAGSQG